MEHKTGHKAPARSIEATARNPSGFLGAKLLLFMGADLVVLKRDDKPNIPFPGYWDLPGGGRDPGESPQDCVLRETREEVGLVLTGRDLRWARTFGQNPRLSWMFAAHVSTGRAGELRLGDEGQELRLMSPAAYLRDPLAVPHFVAQLQRYLADLHRTS